MKDSAKRIAKERIKKLFELAKEEKNGRSKRYVQLARRIATKYNIRLGKLKRKFCKKCNTYFNSKTLKVRTHKKKKQVIYTCLVCGNVQRYPYVKEKA